MAGEYGWAKRPPMPDRSILSPPQAQPIGGMANDLADIVRDYQTDEFTGGGGGGLTGDGSESPDFTDVTVESILADMVQLAPVPDPTPVAGRALIYWSEVSGHIRAMFPSGRRINIGLNEEAEEIGETEFLHFYPDATPGEDVSAGHVYRMLGSSNDEAFATLQAAGSGTTVDDAGAHINVRYAPGDNPNEFHWLARGILRFDTSQLGVAPSAGRVRLKVNDATESLVSESVSLVVYARSPAAGVLDTGDYAAINGADTLGSDDEWPVAALELFEDDYIEFELNAAGLAHIDMDGVTCFALRTKADLDDTDPPDGASATVEFYNAWLNENTPDEWPRLELEIPSDGTP